MTTPRRDHAPRRRSVARDAAVFCALLVLVVVTKAPVLGTLYYWDETLWIGFAETLSALPLWRVLPGLHEPFLFGNRLPGIFLPMAAVFQLTGPSIVVSHAFVLCFAFAGVWFTYCLASLWFGRVAGVLAAVFLFLSPLYFAQSAMFLADLPAAAVAVAAVYFGVQRRFGLYSASACYLVLLKEPVVGVVCAVAAWAFLTRVRTSFPAAVADAARYAVPVAFVTLYYLWQWLATGHAFVHYSWGFKPFAPSLDAALAQLPRVHRWLLVEQGRWAFTLLILAGLGRRSFRSRTELLLVTLVVVGAGYAYTALYFLPRYQLPVAPFFFATSAGALVSLVPGTRLQLAAGALLAALLLGHVEERPGRGNREWDMGYRRVVQVHREACAFIEHALPGRSVRAGFPMWRLLSRPALGYVRQAHPVVRMGVERENPPGADLRSDLVVAAFPGGVDPLEVEAELRGLPVLRRFGDGDLRVTVYDGSGAAPP